VIAVAGKPNKALDTSGTYMKACALLASDLGWGVSEVFSMWRELALMREFELGWPRSCAEWQAMHDVRACLYKPGAEGD
jgi:hypothetical protein